MAIATAVLFLATSLAIAALWNAFYPRVEWRFVLLFVAIVATYQCTTLFTTRVDLPAGLAFRAYPWKAADGQPVVSNTGIVPTQLAPWTRVARDAIVSGEWPLWNRYAASGSPLLANQQTAILHPFTFIGFLSLDVCRAESPEDAQPLLHRESVDHVPSRVIEVAPLVAAHSVDEWKPSGPGRVTVIDYRNNATALRVDATAWSLVASSDTNWPGWRAYVNGERQPTVTVNGAFVGCFVPPGRNVVVFRYRPDAFETGLRLSIVALLGLGLIAVWTFRDALIARTR